MNLKKYLKTGKNMVIELDNGVEYLVDTVAEGSLQQSDGVTGAEKVVLIRLFDREMRMATSKEIEDSLSKNGVTDYLDKKPSKFCTIGIQFSELTRKFGLVLGDYIDLDQMKSFSVDTWENAPDFIQIKFIDDENKSVTIETPSFKEARISLKLGKPYDSISKLNSKKYTLTLMEIGDSKIGYAS